MAGGVIKEVIIDFFYRLGLAMPVALTRSDMYKDGYDGRQIINGVSYGYIHQDGDTYWLSDELMTDTIKDAENMVEYWQKRRDYFKTQQEALASRKEKEAGLTASTDVVQKAKGINSTTLRELPRGWHIVTFSDEKRTAELRVRRWGQDCIHIGFDSGNPVTSDRGPMERYITRSFKIEDFDMPIGGLLHLHIRFKE